MDEIVDGVESCGKYQGAVRGFALTHITESAFAQRKLEFSFWGQYLGESGEGGGDRQTEADRERHRQRPQDRQKETETSTEITRQTERDKDADRLSSAERQTGFETYSF